MIPALGVGARRDMVRRQCVDLPAAAGEGMTAELKNALRVLAAALPTEAVVPVAAGQLLALLGDAAPTGAALLTVEQVAARLAVGPQAVYRRQRELGAVKVGRAVRFPAAGVERYLARRRAAPALTNLAKQLADKAAE